MLHKKATAKPTHGNESKLNRRYKLAITIKIIEIIIPEKGQTFSIQYRLVF